MFLWSSGPPWELDIFGACRVLCEREFAPHVWPLKHLQVGGLRHILWQMSSKASDLKFFLNTFYCSDGPAVHFLKLGIKEKNHKPRWFRDGGHESLPLLLPWVYEAGLTLWPMVDTFLLIHDAVSPSLCSTFQLITTDFLFCVLWLCICLSKEYRVSGCPNLPLVISK